MRHPILLGLCLLALAGYSGGGAADTPSNTVRVDYYHSGNAEHELFSLHQVVIEPLPWPGSPAQSIDTLGRGHFMYRVEDPETGGG